MERHTGDIFEREIMNALDFADVEGERDIRMPELLRKNHLALKASEMPLAFTNALRRHDFDCHGLIGAGVLREVNGSHAASAGVFECGKDQA